MRRIFRSFVRLWDEQAEARLAVPGQDWGDRRVPPRHTPVWVRLAGTWQRGRITAWIRPGTRPGWECQIEPESDSPPGGLPPGGRYVYDPAAIRPRYRGEAAPSRRGPAPRRSA